VGDERALLIPGRADDRGHVYALSSAIEPRFGYQAGDVIDVLERVGRKHGFPHTIRVDQWREFVSRELDLWAYQRGVTLDFYRPGKPMDNAFIESLNGMFRAECLNAHWFMNLDDARARKEAWRRDYNEVRPHSGFGNKQAAGEPGEIGQRHTPTE
jgi:putative transposase